MQRLFLSIALVSLVLAGCATSGVDDATTSTTEPLPVTTTTTVASAFPVTVVTDNGAVTIEERPERIVSISPTSTEVLFAIGAGDQVVAVDSLSNYPQDAPTTELSAFTPSVEAIAAYDPDLVFISYDPVDLVGGLGALGIPVIVHGTAFSLDVAYAQWEQTGVATGHTAEAAQLVAETTTALEAAYAAVPTSADGLTYYYEVDNTYFTATSTSFIGQLVAPTGLVNIADEAPDPDGFGYPQLSAEYIVGANPDLILLADTVYAGENADSVAGRPGWDTIAAVTGGGVVELNDDIASRWGPRLVELVEAVVAAIDSVIGVSA
ncbi:MAG: ABC transporter substrate-binding protein [Acidimicrobiia bacterium]|nr:ABC transporter substrate-binding protein [Acidimicrobiia bacterium]